MSLIFAGGSGTPATGIANIVSAINARITTDASGAKVLDKASLVSWLQDQFKAMVTDGEAISSSYVASIDVQVFVDQLDAQINPRVVAQRPGYPGTTATSATAGVTASAVRAMMGELDALGADVTAYYAGLSDQITDVIADYMAVNAEGNIPAGVTRQIETRAYIYTHVTDRGEESAPSPESELVDVDQNDTVSLVLPAAPTGRHIETARVYRSNLSNSTGDYQLVAEVVVSTSAPTSLTDDVKSTALGEICPSTTWDEPPSNLRNMVMLSNGIIAGIVGNTNTVAFSEAGVPYAWPPEYQKPTRHRPVALAAFGQTLFVGTQGVPVYMSGVDPASISSVDVPSNQALAGPRSLAMVEGGVLFASPDGLCFADASGIRLVTANHYSAEDWKALNPSSIFGAVQDGVYYGFYTKAGGEKGCLAFSLAGNKLGTVSMPASAVYADKVDDTLYVASGLTVKAAFGGNTRRTATFRSKKFTLPKPTNFAWLQVDSDFTASVVIRLYGDGTLCHTATVTGLLPVRIPAGAYLAWEIEVESAARVTGVILATSTAALQEASP